MEGGAPIVGDTVALTAEEALEIAVGAARAAAALLIERFGGPAAGLRVKSSATDMVSEADERAERMVVSYIRERRADDALVAEEGSVASGRFDAYFESVDQPWDWMAGALLVREAGGRVSQLTPANPALPRIVASGSALHDALLELLTKATEAL